MEAQSIKIRADEIHYDFVRSSGPGGQNVNKVTTAVQLLLRLAGKRANSSGEIIIEAKRFRTQQRNREDALNRLLQLIEEASAITRIRRKSHPTAASNLRRLEGKKHRSAVKKFRTRVLKDE
jgi:ribosome-associated protein